MARIEDPDCTMTNTKATLPPNFGANKSALALTYPTKGGQLSFFADFCPRKMWTILGTFDWFDRICFRFSEVIRVTHFPIVPDVSPPCRVLCALIRVSVANIVSRRRGAQSAIFNATQKVKYLNCCRERSCWKFA